MIDNDFSVISTDQLISMVAESERILDDVQKTMVHRNEIPPETRKKLMLKWNELTTWLCQAQCELFERYRRMK